MQYNMRLINPSGRVNKIELQSCETGKKNTSLQIGDRAMASVQRRKGKAPVAGSMAAATRNGGRAGRRRKGVADLNLPKVGKIERAKGNWGNVKRGLVKDRNEKRLNEKLFWH
ncbi:hypothetical protein LXL04_011724 [Taraxacum kok-saghyz]